MDQRQRPPTPISRKLTQGRRSRLSKLKGRRGVCAKWSAPGDICQTFAPARELRKQPRHEHCRPNAAPHAPNFWNEHVTGRRQGKRGKPGEGSSADAARQYGRRYATMTSAERENHKRTVQHREKYCPKTQPTSPPQRGVIAAAAKKQHCAKCLWPNAARSEVFNPQPRPSEEKQNNGASANEKRSWQERRFASRRRRLSRGAAAITSAAPGPTAKRLSKSQTREGVW